MPCSKRSNFNRFQDSSIKSLEIIWYLWRKCSRIWNWTANLLALRCAWLWSRPMCTFDSSSSSRTMWGRGINDHLGKTPTQGIFRKAMNFEEMTGGVNKRRVIQRAVFNELLKLVCVHFYELLLLLFFNFLIHTPSWWKSTRGSEFSKAYHIFTRRIARKSKFNIFQCGPSQSFLRDIFPLDVEVDIYE